MQESDGIHQFRFEQLQERECRHQSQNGHLREPGFSHLSPDVHLQELDGIQFAENMRKHWVLQEFVAADISRLELGLE